MQLHYVEAQRQTFPYATMKVGGPYESGLEALEKIKDFAPLYPDCVVRKATVNVPMKRAAALLGAPKIEERTTA